MRYERVGAFASGSRYPLMGDSLIVCESYRSDVNNSHSPGVLRRLVMSSNAVTASDVIVRDCKGGAAVSPDGTVYYAGEAGIRRLAGGRASGQ